MGLVIVLLGFALETAVIWWLYPGGLVERLGSRYHWLSWLKISPQEKEWTGKLYGMLEDVRVDFPAGEMPDTGIDLPRNTLLPNGMILPTSPYFVPFADNPIPADGGLKVWMFSIRPVFYKSLLRQLAILLMAATLLICLIGLVFPTRWDAELGAAIIICFAFGAWQIVYVFLHFLDKAQPVPVRFLLTIWLVICSCINKDHPIRLLPTAMKPAPSIQQHFSNWLSNTRRDTAMPYYYRSGKMHDTVPVIFVSAEGGALRTGAFTGLLLARLQDRYPVFKNYLYAYSSVSGGTVGADFFNAQIIRDMNHPGTEADWYGHSATFFKTDFLAPAIAKLVFGEILNYFWPCHWACADRAIALEKGYELGWDNAYYDKNNLLAGSFDQTINPQLPLLLINTTEAETGLQNVWSNASLNGIPLDGYRDLREIQAANLRYSSAINLSDRFPLVSPAGTFFRSVKTKNEDSTYRRHFIDGGYYENKGSETLLQVLQALHLEHQKIKPFVLQFNFSTDTTTGSITKFNEITEIIDGIYNTRGGRGRVAQDALTAYVKSLHGEFIPLNLNLDEKQLPMNWVLSETVVRRLQITINALVNLRDNRQAMDDRNKAQLSRLFLCDSAKYMVKRK